MNMQVNPTRMELMKLKKQLDTTRRGHKLLKDKQDEFVHQFIEMIRHYQQLRSEVEDKLMIALDYYLQSCVKRSQLTTFKITK